MQNKKAFTLVELIVVITILAILATVGFVSFSWYLGWARDTNRIAQLKSMSDALELYRTKKDLPIPDDKIDIQANGDTIAYQWYIWANVLETIEYTEKGLDPKDKTYFSYYLTKDKKHFQLLSFLEEGNEDVLSSNNLLKNALAVDYSARQPKTQWKKLWILMDDEKTPVQEVASIVTNGSLDIVTTTDLYKAYLDDTTVVSWSWIVLKWLSSNANCNRIKVAQWQRSNWKYMINPTWSEEIEVYCNMELWWWGWTLIATTADDDDHTWTYDNRDDLINTTTTWSLNNKEKDYKSLAYSQIDFKDMMFEDKQWEWWAYDDINPDYDETVAEWMPLDQACAFWTWRDYYLTSGSISINKWENGTQQDRWLFFSVYDNEWWCNPWSSWWHHSVWPSWWYRNNNWLSPDDPGGMWWWLQNWAWWAAAEWKEWWNARLWVKTYTANETNDWDYIHWYVR